MKASSRIAFSTFIFGRAFDHVAHPIAKRCPIRSRLRNNLGAAELTLDNAATAALEKVSAPQSGGYPYGAFGAGQSALVAGWDASSHASLHGWFRSSDRTRLKPVCESSWVITNFEQCPSAFGSLTGSEKSGLPAKPLNFASRAECLFVQYLLC